MSVQTPPPPPAWHDMRPVAFAVGAIGPPTGFWIRFVAFLIDGLILGIIAGVIVAALAIVAIVIGVGFHGDDDENVALIVIGILLGSLALIIVSWLYEALMTRALAMAPPSASARSGCASCGPMARRCHSAAPPPAISSRP